MSGRSRARDRSRPSGGAPQAWTPAKLADLGGWYFASAGDVTIGTGVSAWTDRAAGRTVTQATGTRQPAYTASHAAFGGIPALTFDGGDWLDAATGYGGTARTIYLIAQHSAATQFAIDTASGVRAGVVYANNGADALDNGGSITIAGSFTGAGIYCFTVNATIGVGAIYRNSTSATASGGVGTNAFGAARRFGAQQSGAFGFVGQIAEVIECTTLHDAATRALVLTYLRDRCGGAITVAGL